jgi:hypothetical protein
VSDTKTKTLFNWVVVTDWRCCDIKTFKTLSFFLSALTSIAHLCHLYWDMHPAEPYVRPVRSIQLAATFPFSCNANVKISILHFSVSLLLTIAIHSHLPLSIASSHSLLTLLREAPHPVCQPSRCTYSPFSTVECQIVMQKWIQIYNNAMLRVLSSGILCCVVLREVYWCFTPQDRCIMFLKTHTTWHNIIGNSTAHSHCCKNPKSCWCSLKLTAENKILISITTVQYFTLLTSHNLEETISWYFATLESICSCIKNVG